MGASSLKKLGLIVFFVFIILALPSYFFLKSKKPLTPSSPAPSNQAKENKNLTKAGTCLVLEQKYCTGGKLTDWESPDKIKYKFVIFTLPSGTPMLAPYDGDMIPNPSGEGNILKVPSASIFDTTGKKGAIFTVMGDIVFIKQTQYVVKKGDIIGTVGETGVKIFDSNIALTYSNSKGSDEKMLLDFK